MLPVNASASIVTGKPIAKRSLSMLLSARIARRAVAGAIGVAALFVGLSPSALADDTPPPPPPPPPPNCTAADLAGVAAGVSAATSAYLFTHPDVNAFFTGLEGAPRDTIRTQVKQYLDYNPTVKADLTGIRQPLVDMKNRCGNEAPLPPA
jgi:hemophore-related protein